MDFTPQPTFLDALREVLQADAAAITLNIDDIFCVANELVPKDQRIRYGAYLRFIDSMDEYGEPTMEHEKAELFMDIHDYIKAQKIKQKMILFKGIVDGDKDWRRFQWLLQWQEKQERQANAQARELAKAQKEKQEALDAVAQLTGGAADVQAVTDTGVDQPAQSSPQTSYNEQQRHLGKVG